VQSQVAIKYVLQKRRPQRGDNTPEILGIYRVQMGIPMPISATNDNGGGHYYEGRPIDASVRQLVTDALAASGVGVVDGDAKRAADLSIEIHDLWIDDLTANIELAVFVLDPQSQLVRKQLRFSRQGVSGPDEPGGGPMSKDATPACRIGTWGPQCLALQRAASAIYEDIAQTFSRAEVIAALQGAVAPAPASSAPAGACEPDCSPGYTCLRGTCVSSCNPPCAAGQRCGADRICHAN
jgi:hypothetical protein